MAPPATTDPPRRRRAARIYARPRFGVKLPRRLWLQIGLTLASLATAAVWVYRRHHP